MGDQGKYFSHIEKRNGQTGGELHGVFSGVGNSEEYLAGISEGIILPAGGHFGGAGKKAGHLSGGAGCRGRASRRCGVSCPDPIFKEIPLRHPLVRTAAQNAASLLAYAFLLSGNLNVLDEKTAPEDQPDAEYRYCLYGEEPAAYDSPNYGIHVKKRSDGDWENIAQAAPFTSDRAAAMLILHYCTKFQLSPQRVLGIVHDFMAGGDPVP